MVPEVEPKRRAHARLVARLLEGPGQTSQSDRRQGFNNAYEAEPLRALLRDVTEQPDRVTDEDIARVKVAGAGEDELFELVVCAVCRKLAAVGSTGPPRTDML